MSDILIENEDRMKKMASLIIKKNRIISPFFWHSPYMKTIILTCIRSPQQNLQPIDF